MSIFITVPTLHYIHLPLSLPCLCSTISTSYFHYLAYALPHLPINSTASPASTPLLNHPPRSYSFFFFLLAFARDWLRHQMLYHKKTSYYGRTFMSCLFYRSKIFILDKGKFEAIPPNSYFQPHQQVLSKIAISFFIKTWAIYIEK